MSDKETLQKLIDDLKTKKFRDGEAKGLLSAIQQEQTKALQPVLEQMAKEIGMNLKKELGEAIKNIKIDIPKIEIPPIDVKVPDINIPEIKLPQINIPPIKIPEIKVPEQTTVFPSKFKVDADKTNPVPVILTNTKGDVYSISEFMPAGGGKQVRQYQEADTASLITGLAALAEGDSDTLFPLQMGSGVSDRALRVVHASDSAVSVSGSFTIAEGTIVQTKQVSGAVDSVIVNSFLTPIDANQISGSAWSVSVIGSTVSQGVTILNGEGLARDSWLVSDITNSTRTVIINPDGLPYSGDNPLPITGSLTPGATYYASDAIGSQNIVQFGGANLSKGLNETDDGVLRVVQMTDSVDSVNVVNSSLPVYQLSGSADSIATQAQGLNETNAGVLRVVQMTDSINSVNVVSSINLEIHQISGSADSVYITGSSGSTYVVGDDLADAADTGGAPVKIGGIARQANPTAVSAGDRVAASFDDLGRQLITPYQVRDLMATAYVTITTGIETALLAGVASTFLDPIHIICANESGAAVNLDFRTGTAGTVMFSVTVPANATAGFVPVVPIPQTEVQQAWTVQNDGTDVSNTTVNVAGLFVKNI